MKPHHFFNIFEEERQLYTLNLVPGKKVYDEKLVQRDGKEYREWNPRKSKLAAAILKGIGQIGVRPGDVVLYLGASSGTTPSHVSDILGKEGFMFALDFAPRVVRDLVVIHNGRDILMIQKELFEKRGICDALRQSKKR